MKKYPQLYKETQTEVCYNLLQLIQDYCRFINRILSKNIYKIFGPSGYIRTTYTYTPFGAVTASGDVTQPIQWSSEYYDSELALVYYNYRHYNPTDGRWINRDPIAEQGGWNLYGYSSILIDFLGKADFEIIAKLPSNFKPTSDPGSGVHGALAKTSRDKEVFYELLFMVAAGAFVHRLASIHLNHYLENTGAPRCVDIEDFFNTESFQKAIKKEKESLELFLRKQKGKGCHKYTVASKKTSSSEFSQDGEESGYFYAIGGYQIWTEGKVIYNIDRGSYKAFLMLHFYDRYNWDIGKVTHVAGIFPFTDAEIGRLHSVGLAKEYDINGLTLIQIDGDVNNINSGTITQKQNSR